MRGIQELYHAGNSIKRWHTKPTLGEQTVAQHSWGVAMIVKYIYPEANADLLLCALTHDLAEIETGDIPYPFKKRNPWLQEGLYEHEASFVDEFQLPTTVPAGLGERVLKWADMFELLMYARNQVAMGNSHFINTQRVAREALIDMGPPTNKAKELYDEFNRSAILS